MVGYPKHLNTRDDYEYIRVHFTDKAKAEFQTLLDSVKDWFFVRNLDEGEVGITDETHRVITMENVGQNEDETQTRAQYELRENPTAKIFRLGYTVSEVEQIIKSSAG